LEVHVTFTHLAVVI